MEIPTYFTTMIGDGGQRRKTASLLTKTLMTSKRFAEESKEYKEAIIVSCERGVFNRAIALLRNDPNHIVSWSTPEFIAAYCCARQTLCQRLANIGANADLESIVLEKRIPWVDLCTVPVQQLLPDVFSQQAQSLLERKAVEIEVTYDKGNCTECGSHKIKYMSDQTRSADESSDPSLFCYQCNLSIKLDV